MPPSNPPIRLIALSVLMIVLIALGVLYLLTTDTNTSKEIVELPPVDFSLESAVPVTSEIQQTIESPEEMTQTTISSFPTYHAYTISTANPAQELVDLFGQEYMSTILRINRINSRFLKTGDTITVPDVFLADIKEYSPFPHEISTAHDIPKLIIISQRIQAFGIYESGILVKWGPTSTGKASSPTPNGLFFTNWKGKSVVSTIDDGWILKWNFNLDNRRGVSMHEYALPGYPASHACARLFGSDAKWIYEWADQWILSGDTQIAKGTPTIIFGEYDYTQDAPWKQLVTNPEAIHISLDEAEELVTTHYNAIMNAYTQRIELLGASVSSVATNTEVDSNTSNETSTLHIRR